jgi:glycosyltransferase involved in cell wall biosynthesis
VDESNVSPGEPSVSIVIPCYNYGRFLAEAITSALEQSHTPLEVIVIDDGSTDSSYEIALRFAPAARVLTQANGGVLAVVNRGLREAQGEYVTFLSADDVFRPTYVEALLGALLRHPAASYAYSAMEYFGARHGVFRAHPFSPAVLLARNFVNGSALMRRSDALAVGGFDSRFEAIGWEDWDFWLRMLEFGRWGVAVSDPLLRYRQHTTKSRNPGSRNLRRRLRVFAAHPALYGRRPHVVRETLLFVGLVGSMIRCPRCLQLLDRAWGFSAQESSP